MTTSDDRVPGDPESAATVGAADADADAERAGAPTDDTDPSGDITSLRVDDPNLAEDEGVDSDGTPVGSADADEDARRAGA